VVRSAAGNPAVPSRPTVVMAVMAVVPVSALPTTSRPSCASLFAP
jgi:hypothetical protein